MKEFVHVGEYLNHALVKIMISQIRVLKNVIVLIMKLIMKHVAQRDQRMI